MCIAIVKKEGVNLPSKDILKICFKNNPDGAGFAYCRNNKIIIQKGFFTFNGFYKALENANIKKNEAALIHFRVATHGKVNASNCHPFPIVNKFTKMIQPKIVTDSDVMIHNGKLSINITNSIYSDSMHMAKALFGLDRNTNKKFINYIIRSTDKNKRGSRIGVLTKEGKIEVYGDGWIPDNDILYSNDSYKENYTCRKNKKNLKTTNFNSDYNYINYCPVCYKHGKTVHLNNYIVFKKNTAIYLTACDDCIKMKNVIKCTKCNYYFEPSYMSGSICQDCLKYSNPFGQINMKNGRLLLGE